MFPVDKLQPTEDQVNEAKQTAIEWLAAFFAKQPELLKKKLAETNEQFAKYQQKDN